METVKASDPLLESLAGVLRSIAPDGRFAIAYSGGLDSRFLSHASKLFGMEPILFHVSGPHEGGDEAEAAAWTKRNGLAYRLVEMDPLQVLEVAEGSRYRCYGCKKAVFSRLIAEAGGLPLCDGTNHSDKAPGVWRPGLMALSELGVRSPLAEAGLGKPEIRRLAALTGMERPDQMPEPCMLTRLPYGMSPTRDLLLALGRAEAAVAAVCRDETDFAGKCFRIRFVPGSGYELHFSREGWERLGTDEARESAREAAVKAAPELLADLKVLPKERLSGFFDRLAAGGDLA